VKAAVLITVVWRVNGGISEFLIVPEVAAELQRQATVGGGQAFQDSPRITEAESSLEESRMKIVDGLRREESGILGFRRWECGGANEKYPNGFSIGLCYLLLASYQPFEPMKISAS
jgi:hypothetical protein